MQDVITKVHGAWIDGTFFDLSPAAYSVNAGTFSIQLNPSGIFTITEGTPEMTNTYTTANTNTLYYNFDLDTQEKEAPKKMKAKEALAQVIALSAWTGDVKDYEGFIQYVKDDNAIAADHVQCITEILSALSLVEHNYR